MTKQTKPAKAEGRDRPVFTPSQIAAGAAALRLSLGEFVSEEDYAASVAVMLSAFSHDVSASRL